jgi:hypothetical protein
MGLPDIWESLVKTVETQITITKNLEEDSGYILMSDSVFRISEKDCCLY